MFLMSTKSDFTVSLCYWHQFIRKYFGAGRDADDDHEEDNDDEDDDEDDYKDDYKDDEDDYKMLESVLWAGRSF